MEQGTDAHLPSQHTPTRYGTVLKMTNPLNVQLNPKAPAFTSTPPDKLSGPVVRPPTTLSFYTDSNKMLLLQTAVAEVVNPRDPSCALKVGIVFDGGSQKSYLIQRVKGSLNCSPGLQQAVSVNHCLWFQEGTAQAL